MKGKSTLIISHRVSSAKLADKIIVLDKGEIKEIGSHEELLQSGGFYSKLHEMQFEKHPAKV